MCSSFVKMFSPRVCRGFFLCLQASAPLIFLPTKTFMHEYEQYSLLYEFRGSVNWRHDRLREFCLFFAFKKFPLLWSSGSIYWFVGSHLSCIKDYATMWLWNEVFYPVSVWNNILQTKDHGRKISVMCNRPIRTSNSSPDVTRGCW